jgi:hypothetical protein
MPLSETLTLPVDLSKLPLKDRRPRAPANVPVPPVTAAVPEKETLFPPPAAHAWPRRALNRSEPALPLSTARPLNVTHVWLVNVPCAEPFSVPRPIGLPRPRSVALPEALVPEASP